jgi:hypothetical protein
MPTYTINGKRITTESPLTEEQIDEIAGELGGGTAAPQPEMQTRTGRPAPTSISDLFEPFTRQVVRGAIMDPINAVRQLVSEEQRKLVTKEEEAYQAKRTKMGETDYEYGRLVGNILSPAPLMAGTAAVRAVGGTGRLARVRQAAGAGAAGAVLQPVLETDVEFADEKIRQLGLGAVTGGLLEGGIQSVTGGVNFLREFVRPMSQEGRDTILRNFLNKLSGPERDQVMTALRNADELVPGSRPTAAEAVAEVPGATGLAAFQRQLETDQLAGTAPLFAVREAEQEAARLAALGADETAAPMMRALREARTAPMRQEALEQANIAGQIAPGLEADIAARELSRIQARQLEGQMQGRAAEQGVLAQQPFTPVPGLPRVSSRYRPNIDRAAEAIDASKEAGDIASQRLAEVNFKKLQLQSLEDEGFYALKINPLLDKIGNILKTPGQRSEIAEKSLLSLQDKLIKNASPNGVIDSRDLYTIRKELATDIKKFADEAKSPVTQQLAGLEISIRKSMDNAIESAGGVKWKDYLKNYTDYSEKINRMEIGQALAEKLRTSLRDTERAGAFATAVQNAASTIKRATGGARYETAGEILSESERKAMNSVLADLQRSAKAGRLMGKAKISGMDEVETPELPQLLSRTAAIGNFLLRALNKNAQNEIRQRASELFLDTNQLAIFMQQPNSAKAITAIYKKLPPDIQDFLQRVVAVQTVGQPITPME